MPQLTDAEALTRMAIAMALGALLGVERERTDKPAGIRTYMLVAEGAALFIICGLMLAAQLTANGLVSDPGRIASTVVQGIGFLAGGVILTTGRRVHGMTTAASIWVAAALGLLVGAGFVVVATVATLVTIAALLVIHQLEVRVLPFGRHSTAGSLRRDEDDRRDGEPE